MIAKSDNLLRIGHWCVNPLSGQLSRGDESVRLEARPLRLLLHLAARAGEVVSIDELLDEVWTGVVVTPDSVYQAITSLRRVLGDDPKQPAYIATVPRLGYRMIADVEPLGAARGADSVAATVVAPATVATPTVGTPQPALRSRGPLFAGIAIAIVLAFVAVYGFAGRQREEHAVEVGAAQSHPRSIGVVPFLDLTEGMHEETFADGMTEELIGKLSKVAGLKVPAPTASFFYKDKQVAVGEIGRALGVAYLLDGSVRQAGDRLRVSARLVRADDGFVLWSENYDRPLGDILMVQDDIATEVRKALLVEIDGAVRPQVN